MNTDVQKIVDAAMGRSNEYGAMVRHYTNLVESAKGGASPSPEVTEGLTSELETARRDHAVALSVLAAVLDVAGYDVREPFPDGSGDEPSIIKAEAVLNAWRETRKAAA